MTEFETQSQCLHCFIKLLIHKCTTDWRFPEAHSFWIIEDAFNIFCGIGATHDTTLKMHWLIAPDYEAVVPGQAGTIHKIYTSTM